MRRIYKKILSLIPPVCLCALLLSLGAQAEAAGRMLVPGGQVVGIRLECEGVLVAGINEAGSGSAHASGIRAGDIITHVGAEKISDIKELRERLSEWQGGELTLRVLRGDEEVQLGITPRAANGGGAELGLWLRDGMAGLGTISYYDPATGEYGALGHAVNDIDTGVTLPVQSGEIMQAEVSGVVRGECGRPGELLGSFGGDALGRIEQNCAFGIFGALADGAGPEGEPMEAAERSEVRTGPATILAGVDGSVEEYRVEISRIYPGDKSGRDMLIEICDPELLEKTGGIVQGMGVRYNRDNTGNP